MDAQFAIALLASKGLTAEILSQDAVTIVRTVNDVPTWSDLWLDEVAPFIASLE